MNCTSPRLAGVGVEPEDDARIGNSCEYLMRELTLKTLPAELTRRIKASWWSASSCRSTCGGERCLFGPYPSTELLRYLPALSAVVKPHLRLVYPARPRFLLSPARRRIGAFSPIATIARRTSVKESDTTPRSRKSARITRQLSGRSASSAISAPVASRSGQIRR